MPRRYIFKYPAVSRNDVAFVYAGDIWVARKGGRKARKLTSARGQELYPRFSPDGKWIAFSSSYAGSQDIYAVSTDGGVPQRLTFHPLAERMVDWLPDGSILFARDTYPFFVRRLYRLKVRWTEENGCVRKVAADGEPEELPLRYGAYGHVSSSWRLAFQTVVRGFSRFRGYRGALAPEIHLVDLKKSSSKKLKLKSEIRNITLSSANDSHPMWDPKGKRLFFVSDRASRDRYNLYVINDPTAEKPKAHQLTFNTTVDVRAPSIGPKDIIWEQDGQLHLLPLKDIDNDRPEAKALELEVRSDRVELMPQWRKVGDLIASYDLSPDGEKVVFEARGQIFVVEGMNGPIRQLTRDSGVANRYPAFSPDGSRVAYFSDAPRDCGEHSSCKTSEYHLVVRASDGSGEEELLHCFEDGFRFRIFWSPKGNRLAFADLKDDKLGFYDFDSGEYHEVDRLVRFIQNVRPRYTVSWSPCGHWLAYARRAVRSLSSLYIYNVKEKKRYRLTGGFYDESNPVFDPDGHYLFYLSKRNFSAMRSDFREGSIFGNSTQVIAIRLREDLPQIRDWKQATRPTERKNDSKPISIDLGKDQIFTDDVIDCHHTFEKRTEVLDIPAGNIESIQVDRDKIYYLRSSRTGSAENITSIQVFDLLEQREKQIVSPVDEYRLANDAPKVLIEAQGKFALLPTDTDQTLPKTYLPTYKMHCTVDAPKEWMQIFHDVWRICRDDFYDPSSVRQSWMELRHHYAEMVRKCASRWDVNDIMNRMLGELRASHTGAASGDGNRPKLERNMGFLGADLEIVENGWKVSKILDPGLWNINLRSPMEAARIKENQSIIKINGVPVNQYQSTWLAFEGLAEHRVELGVKASESDTVRNLYVQLLNQKQEQQLRYWAWVEANRRFVEDNTPRRFAGKIGYIHIPNVGIFGQGELLRQFLWQVSREALIFDVRFNYGGNETPERFLRLISQQTPNILDLRYDDPEPTVTLAHFGHKTLLVNSRTASNGEHLAYLFQHLNQGAVIGSQTAGMTIGSSGSPSLVDGGNISLANWLIQGQGEGLTDGRSLFIENNNTIEENLISANHGGDDQLEFAIREAVDFLKSTTINTEDS